MTERALPTGEIAEIQKAITVPGQTNTPVLLDENQFNQMMRMAEVYSKSKLVPVAYQGHKEDCFIAIDMANRLGVHPQMFMQNSYVVSGKPGMEGKLVIALINARGPFKGPVQYRLEGEGDTRSCTAFATHAQTGDVCEATVDVPMAKKMGWWGKTNSFWPKMTDLMLQYRSATFLARAHCPEVMMGMKTVDELRDIIDITPVAKPGQSHTQGEPEQTPDNHPHHRKMPPLGSAPAEMVEEAAVATPRTIGPFPQQQIPEDVFQAETGTPLNLALVGFQTAWPTLPINPNGLAVIYAKEGSAWGKGASPSDVELLKKLKNTVFEKAGQSGFPQVVKKK